MTGSIKRHVRNLVKLKGRLTYTVYKLATQLIMTPEISEEDFDEEFYLKIYQEIAHDIRAGKISSGYDHWLRFGRREGRAYAPGVDLKQKLSDKYIRGNGLEIGALHSPLWTADEGVNVRYVDRVSSEILKSYHPELDPETILPVSVIDDCETLSKVPDESQNFIIMNQVLEHCQNPLGTIRNQLSKLSDQGVLFLTLPDKVKYFDCHRPVTEFEHFVRDDLEGAQVSFEDHIREWIALGEWVVFDKPRYTPEQVEARTIQFFKESTGDSVNKNVSIHFHVWDMKSFASFLFKTQTYLKNSFHVEYFDYYTLRSELIAVLVKDKKPLS